MLGNGVVLVVLGVWFIAQVTVGHALDRLGLVDAILNQTPPATPAATK